VDAHFAGDKRNVIAKNPVSDAVKVGGTAYELRDVPSEKTPQKRLGNLGDTEPMHELSDDEIHLLKHYGESERVIGGPERTTVHQRLLALGYIREQSVNIGELLIIVTDEGRTALRSLS
jgi:hypothetical protein